ncbi:hypothetical protein SAMN05216167_102325 [Spirosoma endophyticum]|uniref:Uncharacterized protein n=1 Tax=Spirosoma endophyticum TaxID=662367 RepID=A0A1I1LT20_9BACT|nr:hypothetical protein SAMN05216167_102325 [Spirosoma endophyticum]
MLNLLIGYSTVIELGKQLTPIFQVSTGKGSLSECSKKSLIIRLPGLHAIRLSLRCNLLYGQFCLCEKVITHMVRCF